MRLHVPLIARTRTTYQPVGPVSYDCVKIIVVREGRATLFSEFGQWSVVVGDAVSYTHLDVYKRQVQRCAVKLDHYTSSAWCGQ